MDTRFLKWIERGEYGPDVRKQFAQSLAYKVWMATYVIKVPAEFFLIRVYKDYASGLRAFTFDMTKGIGHGNNSGYGALNLAACLGANPIYLLGFDMMHHYDETNKAKTHWHGGHPSPQREKTVTSFIQHFNRAAPILKEKGINVINLSPGSALTCFKKAKPEEYL
jgi:hypothetical protein